MHGASRAAAIQTQGAHKAQASFERCAYRRELVHPRQERLELSGIGCGGHFGADELYIKMKTEKSNISRATIYNTLELLASCELLAKRNFGDGVTRYESSYNRKNHDHLICTNCGSIKEFSSPKIQKIVEEISKELGFDNTGYSFNIFGKCLNHKNCKHAKHNG